MDGVSAAPLISPEEEAEIRAQYRRNDGVSVVFRELDRVRAHNEYLTKMFYGVASLKLCERHNAISIVERVRERVTGSWCQDCIADENDRLLQIVTLDLSFDERDLILLVRAEQAKRDTQPPSSDSETPPPLPRAGETRS